MKRLAGKVRDRGGLPCALYGAFLLVATVQAIPTPLQIRDQLKWFRPEAARMAVEDMKNMPGYDYARHHAAVERMIGGFDAATNRLAYLPSGEVDDDTASLVEGYRQAILSNHAAGVLTRGLLQR